MSIAMILRIRSKTHKRKIKNKFYLAGVTFHGIRKPRTESNAINPKPVRNMSDVCVAYIIH